MRGYPLVRHEHTQPVATYNLNGTSSATVTVTGSIGQHDDGKTAPNNAITGQVDYSRIFSVTSQGLTITTSLTSDETDTVSELWESLPIYLGEDSSQDATIEFRVGGSWQNATTSTITSDLVRIGRNGEFVEISFDAPQQLKLSPYVWTTDYQAESRMRNIMVDLLNTGGSSTQMPASTSVTYTLRRPSTGNQSPTVTLDNPTGGQIFQAPAEINIAATATDADGSVTKVEFYEGSSWLGEELEWK